jgi:uncharacterized protein
MTRIPFLDPHVHTECRSTEDFERLKSSGCVGVLAVSGTQGGFRSPDSVLDHFERLDRYERKRIERVGLKFWLALGIHPLGIPKRGVEELMEQLPALLQRHHVDAVGEIGLESGSEMEEMVFSKQLSLAADLGLPVIVQAPQKKKANVAKKTMVLLEENPLNPARILLNHIHEEGRPEAIEKGCLLGLSVHPFGFSPEQVTALVTRTPDARFVLSADLGSQPSYLMGMPAAIVAMEDAGVPGEKIRAVVHDHAAEWLGR